MFSKELIDDTKSILFRIGRVDRIGVLQYYAIKRLQFNGPLQELKEETKTFLPYRLDMEVSGVADFLKENYPNTAIIKYGYTYYGPTPINFYANDHCVDGYVFTQSPVSNTEDYTSVLRRGNIFLLQASPLIWRELSKKDIKRSNIVITRPVE